MENKNEIIEINKPKERINFFKDGEFYIARSVNTPVNCQAKSIEEMKHKIPIMMKMWIKFMEDIVNENEFVYVDETEQWEKTKNS